jgi:hypothetical protein
LHFALPLICRKEPLSHFPLVSFAIQALMVSAPAVEVASDRLIATTAASAAIAPTLVCAEVPVVND